MAYLVSHMKGQQHLSTWSQHAPKLAQHGGYLGWRNVDDRVESCNAAPARVGHLQSRHVPNTKLDPAIELPRQLNHARRKIHTQHLRALLVEITSNMPWPAAQIADGARVSHCCGKPRQPLTVQWLVFQLVVDTRDVLICQGIVAGADLKIFVHRCSPECGSTISQFLLFWYELLRPACSCSSQSERG